MIVSQMLWTDVKYGPDPSAGRDWMYLCVWFLLLLLNVMSGEDNRRTFHFKVLYCSDITKLSLWPSWMI